MRFYDPLAAQLAALPDTSFSFSNFVAFFQPVRSPLEIDASTAPQPRAAVFIVSEGYFPMLGIELRRGRNFAASDRAGAEPVVIVSESLARQIAPGGNALGQRIRGEPFRRLQETNAGNSETPVWRTIVGIVADVRHTYEDAESRDIYVPFAQAPNRFTTLLVRTSMAPARWAEAVQAAGSAVDPNVFVAPAPPLSEAVDRQLAGPRFLLSLLSAFAVSAVLLAFIGLYGVTAYAVRQHERDIAIRIAIGATPRSIVRLFLRGAGFVIGVGIAAGLFGAMALSQLLESQLHEIEPYDPGTLAAGCILLAIVGLLATWWPARRAARIDPMLVLRSE
jgi:putative ABC transport system permease protein